jgi:phosphohistidine phosphatase
LATKRLYLLRHAKSSRDDPALEDFDRPLAPRGRRDSRALRNRLRADEVAPSLVLCSPALRTRETYEAIATALPRGHALRLERGLYLASARSLLGWLRRVEDEIDVVMLVGHNPGLHRLAVQLAGKGKASLRAGLAAKLPTAALVHLAFPIERWRDLAEGSGTLRAFVRPREQEEG